MPKFKKNPSPAMKRSGFKMKSSPAKLFGWGKSARQKRARKYELEDRETRRLAYENASLTGGTGEGN
jgi:hypothetical protein